MTISRGRKRVVIFTSDKEALRADITRAADRPLAVELRPVPERLKPLEPTWVQRAREAIATVQRRDFLRRCRTKITTHLRRTV